MNKRFILDLADFKLSDTTDHINKMPFSGVCAFVDTPSDGSPGGACGSKVVFTKEAVLAALDTFPGMGVNCVWDGSWADAENVMTGHDDRFKVGVVETASLDGDAVGITGSLWKYDFSDVCFMVKNAKDSLGFSVEVIVNNMEERDGVIYVTALTFTGVAILYSDLAAFKQTKIAASAANRRSDSMNEEAIRALLAEVRAEIVAEVTADFEVKLNAVNEALATANGTVEALQTQLGEANDKFTAMAEEKEVVATANTELIAKVDAMGLELADVKEAKVDKIERKSMQFVTVAKFEGEGKDTKTICAEISADTTLTASQKWQLKLAAWKKAE